MGKSMNAVAFTVWSILYETKGMLRKGSYLSLADEDVLRCLRQLKFCKCILIKSLNRLGAAYHFSFLTTDGYTTLIPHSSRSHSR